MESLEMTTNEKDLSPESLKKVVKRIKIEEELKNLETKKEKLKIRAEIEESDFSGEIDELDQKIAELIDEKEKYGALEHPIFDLVKKQKTLNDRIKKLEEKRSTIQISVYDSLKNEYMGEKEVVVNQINQILEQLRELRQGASKGAQSLKYSIEELSVRKEIEEIPEEVFNQQISDLKIELAQSEELLAATEFLLEMVRN
jgi:chromosome segregation ATPase